MFSFTETLKSLINFYPLTIDKVDENQLINTVGSYDYIQYSSIYSGTNMVLNVDSYNLFNWSTTFDWGASNLGNYITSMTGSSKNFFIFSYFFEYMRKSMQKVLL